MLLLIIKSIVFTFALFLSYIVIWNDFSHQKKTPHEGAGVGAVVAGVLWGIFYLLYNL